jgi:hypothetical protein
MSLVLIRPNSLDACLQAEVNEVDNSVPKTLQIFKFFGKVKVLTSPRDERVLGEQRYDTTHS